MLSNGIIRWHIPLVHTPGLPPALTIQVRVDMMILDLELFLLLIKNTEKQLDRIAIGLLGSWLLAEKLQRIKYQY